MGLLGFPTHNCRGSPERTIVTSVACASRGSAVELKILTLPEHSSLIAEDKRMD